MNTAFIIKAQRNKRKGVLYNEKNIIMYSEHSFFVNDRTAYEHAGKCSGNAC